ncbi:hypothetical protein GCM10023189_27120 [Nibrella saemangeumensis]|uniref:FecR family protein n=1 Tax=Nibrella saemangeumensis TaxID=1084526 RepID=A0ABP8MVZ1_9BACT
MSRKTLRDLLQRYVNNDCTPDERQLVEQWYELLGEESTQALTEAEYQQLEERIWQQLLRQQPQLEVETAEPEVNVQPLWRRWAAGGAAAAAVVGILWFSLSYLNQNPQRNQPGLAATHTPLDFTWTERANTGTQAMVIVLPDSSHVTLEPNARLAISPLFNRSNREVRLEGTANFAVRRNTSQPFIVYSGEVATRVLGTEFMIHSVPGFETVEVAVKSGKVTVYRSQNEMKEKETSGSSGIILTPNQKATYYTDNKHFVAGIVEKPAPIQPQPNTPTAQNAFAFEETPLTTVLDLLEDTYGIDIELERPVLGECTFTGNLANQPLFTKLDMVCGTINASYEVRGTKILITGKGCR